MGTKLPADYDDATWASLGPHERARSWDALADSLHGHLGRLDPCNNAEDVAVWDRLREMIEQARRARDDERSAARESTRLR